MGRGVLMAADMVITVITTTATVAGITPAAMGTEADVDIIEATAGGNA